MLSRMHLGPVRKSSWVERQKRLEPEAPPPRTCSRRSLDKDGAQKVTAVSPRSTPGSFTTLHGGGRLRSVLDKAIEQRARRNVREVLNQATENRPEVHVENATDEAIQETNMKIPEAQVAWVPTLEALEDLRGHLEKVAVPKEQPCVKKGGCELRARRNRQFWGAAAVPTPSIREPAKTALQHEAALDADCSTRASSTLTLQSLGDFSESDSESHEETTEVQVKKLAEEAKDDAAEVIMEKIPKAEVAELRSTPTAFGAVPAPPLESLGDIHEWDSDSDSDSEPGDTPEVHVKQAVGEAAEKVMLEKIRNDVRRSSFQSCGTASMSTFASLADVADAATCTLESMPLLSDVSSTSAEALPLTSSPGFGQNIVFSASPADFLDGAVDKLVTRLREEGTWAAPDDGELRVSDFLGKQLLQAELAREEESRALRGALSQAEAAELRAMQQLVESREAFHRAESEYRGELSARRRCAEHLAGQVEELQAEFGERGYEMHAWHIRAKALEAQLDKVQDLHVHRGKAPETMVEPKIVGRTRDRIRLPRRSITVEVMLPPGC